MKNTAELSECRKYRYVLWRMWDEQKPYVMFVGLNPSTADETQDDPTIRRCVNFAKSWGYGAICMTNLFAYRATKPNDMKAFSDPVGVLNNDWLCKLSADAGIVVAAWGVNGNHLGRSGEVSNMIENLHCLGLTISGEPRHPLYLRSNVTPKLLINQNGKQ